MGDEGKQAKKIGGVSGPPPYPGRISPYQVSLLLGDRVESQVEGGYGTKNQRLAPIFRALVLVPVRQHTR